MVERQTGKTPTELIGPDYPIAVSHLWFAFLHLSSSRNQGFNGPLPLGYDTIKHYIELTGTPLEPWEVQAIKELDRVYLKVAHG